MKSSLGLWICITCKAECCLSELALLCLLTRQNLNALVNFHIDKLVYKQALTLTQRLQAASDRNTHEPVKCK